MGNKLYVGNLPFSTTDDAVKQLFEQHGTVASVKLIIDKISGRSKGFGFVEMSSDEEAAAAIEKLNGQEFEGRTLKVAEAHPKQPRQGGGGRGGYGDRSGYGGNR